MGLKEEKAHEYASRKYIWNHDMSRRAEESYKAGWDAAKGELLKEFQEHFCDVYCQFFGNDDYCKRCPIKDSTEWLI